MKRYNKSHNVRDNAMFVHFIVISLLLVYGVKVVN